MGGESYIYATTTQLTPAEHRLWPKLVRALRESRSAGNVEHVMRGGSNDFPASLPTKDLQYTLSTDRTWMFGCIRWATAPFLFTVQSVLSFAYPGKFEHEVDESMNRDDGEGGDNVYRVVSDTLLGCDDELKATVRALKADMHAAPSLAELAHDCVVGNGLAAALEGLELAPPSRPSEL
ncbi:hypothetical protein FOA52_001079 [Chlamydomonas sp. UWO 241]|nr:hypothetical protein FOA52_001079 [Chlamydomonas sp. UWO 241]